MTQQRKKIVKYAIKVKRFFMIEYAQKQYFSDGRAIFDITHDEKVKDVLTERGFENTGTYRYGTEGVGKMADEQVNILTEFLKLDGNGGEIVSPDEMDVRIGYLDASIYSGEKSVTGIQTQYKCLTEDNQPIYYYKSKGCLRTFSSVVMCVRLNDRVFNNDKFENKIKRLLELQTETT